MNKGILKYLRASTLLRIFSAATLMALTSSSIIASNCSSCSMGTEKIMKQSSCSMSKSLQTQSSQELISEKMNSGSSTCCCSTPDTEQIEIAKLTEPANIPALAKSPTKSSCCSMDQTLGIGKTAEEARLSIQVTDLVLNPTASLLPEQLNRENSTCNHSGSCSTHVQTDSKTAPPPLRSLEQEQQVNKTLLNSIHPALSSAVDPAKSPNKKTSILLAEPSILSGIGSQQLIC